MKPLKLKFKKLHPDAVLPKYAKLGDAALDLTAVHISYDDFNEVYRVDTGLSVEIPDGYVGLLFPRSSIYGTSMQLCNSVGVLDSKYRNSICFNFSVRNQTIKNIYEVGDRIGQLIVLPYPIMEPEFVDELDMTNDRGGGFGSTNR